MLLEPGDASAREIIDLNPQMRSWRLGAQELVHWRNKQGGSGVGILIKPVGYQEGHRYPVIVDVYPQQTAGFKGYAMAGNQAWAWRGYAVFYPNPRPPHFSSSLAKTDDQIAARGPQGWDTAVDDVLSSVDELVRMGLADPERLGLYGFSNGGGVVNYLVTRTDRFRCAVSVAAALPDWASAVLLQTDSWLPNLAGSITPWDDPSGYIKLSAVYHVNTVSTPMLLAVGDHDEHNFVLGAVEMFNGLRRFGDPVTFLRYPDQSHGFIGEAMEDFWVRENAFFDRYLKDDIRVGRAETK